MITAYNIDAFIRESIEAAFKQTYTPLEIVLSDDCSSDRTYKIMEEMALSYTGPHKIKLNKNPRNLGITQHMNKAYLELATGDIIIAAHGDDISRYDRAEKTYQFFVNHKDYSALSLSIVSIDEQGNELPGVSTNIVKDIKTYSIRDENVKAIPNIPAPSRAFYRRVMTEFGPMHPSCPTEDEVISFRSLLLGKNAFLPDIGVFYRKHRKSSSNIENFYKFPLEKIYEQQLRDISIARERSYITNEEAQQLARLLQIGFRRRKLTRNHYAKKNMSSLLKILNSELFSIRQKYYYVRRHIKYKSKPKIYK